MKRIVIVICFSFLVKSSYAQQDFTVAFYNVENLMDTLDNPHTLDNDFLPQGKYKWNSARYKKKVSSIAKVIAKLGDVDGPELIGLSEIENKNVVKDLTNSKELKSHGYLLVHYDSPDQRGIDVALLYKAKSFQLISSRVYSAAFLTIKSHTRDMLLVKGMVGKDTVFLLVNHWPSRRKGKAESEDKRIAVSIMVREVVDSILQKSAIAKIIVMGDFNDEPFDRSIAIELNTTAESNSKKDELFNPFYNLSRAGEGSVNYSHKWNMFDQIMLSNGFFSDKRGGLVYKQAFVYHPSWLHYQQNSKNGPYRTFMGSDYKGGYSDHFPVYIHFLKN